LASNEKKRNLGIVNRSGRGLFKGLVPLFLWKVSEGVPILLTKVSGCKLD